ncbi:MAG: SPOR domain-containing protein [Proteobacteria bacterium]|nr:SPOR domain-containing protein [Pseudomonadota bacterium]
MPSARSTDTPRAPNRSNGGGSIVSFSAGVAVGLVVAAAVAAYLTITPPPFQDRGLRKPEPAVAKKAAPEEAASAAPPVPAAAAPPPPQLADPQGPPLAEPPGTTYFLQVAAYRSVDEADQMRARLAILGFEAAVSQIKRDNTVFHRVRLGPFSDFEVLNRTKVSLAENGLESTLVRVLPAQ